MRSKIFSSCLVFLLCIGSVGIAGSAMADEMSVAGTVVSADDDRVVLRTEDGMKTYTWHSDADYTLAVDDGVVLHFDEDGMIANRAVVIEDEVMVRGDKMEGEQYGAIIGKVKISNPEQLIIKTRSGETGFVVDPMSKYPPIPQPDDVVAVVYAVRDGFNDDAKYVLSEVVTMPDSAWAMADTELDGATTDVEMEMNVRADMDKDEAMDEMRDMRADARAEMDVDVDADMDVDVDTDVSYQQDSNRRGYQRDTLPQTAGSVPMVALVGLLSLIGFAVLRIRR